ncbi:MAG TPA: hypothetical protein VFU15_07810 [Bacteroidia bacterium]|nr:hypothetical protein [Bacteroidia bacterium]
MKPEKGKRVGNLWKGFLFAVLLLQGNVLLADESSQQTSDSSTGTTAGEILLCIAGIVVIILIAWFFGGGQSKNADIHHAPHGQRRHFDHMNDPHFRKLRKKTS